MVLRNCGISINSYSITNCRSHPRRWGEQVNVCPANLDVPWLGEDLQGDEVGLPGRVEGRLHQGLPEREEGAVEVVEVLAAGER